MISSIAKYAIWDFSARQLNRASTTAHSVLMFNPLISNNFNDSKLAVGFAAVVAFPFATILFTKV